MNAVWLTDGLMVSPAAVAGLRVTEVTSGTPPQWSFVVDVLFTGGSQARVAEVVDRATAQAEVERLSELLWPAELPPLRLNTIPDIRIYDPELYGLAVCGEATPWEPVEHCNLALGHPGAHRPGPTVSGAYPTKMCGSVSDAGTRCTSGFAHGGPHRDPDGLEWTKTHHV